MIRSMTSYVSTLSGCVANGHQAIPSFPPPPLKFRTAGFPSVRLQTCLMPRPPSKALCHPLIGRHCLCSCPRLYFRIGTCVQAEPRNTNPDHRSSGPWLPDRLYCPAGSSLTMATSAPLSATGGLCIMTPSRGSNPPAAEGPQFTLPIRSHHAVARTPVIPATACDDAFVAGNAFATSALARQSQFPPFRSSGLRNEAAAFA